MRKLAILLVFALVLASFASAAGGLSMQLKRTNPGIAGEKSATLIFDVVNTDMEHKLQGFIWCMSPDDARVSSSYGGASTGSATQYVSPLFYMDKGPYQSSMTLTLDADSVGDKNAGCYFKYIPYSEKEVVAGSTITEPFTKEAQIDATTGKDVEGFIITFKSFTAAVEAKEATETEEAVEAKAAMVKIDVDGTEKELELGKEDTVKDVKVKVTAADDKGATITVSGSKVVKPTGTTIKLYQKMNGEEVTNVVDMDYREIRLDKTVPFVAKMSDPQCPEGKTECKAGEVVDVGGFKVPIVWIVVAVAVIILLVAYLLGRGSRS